MNKQHLPYLERRRRVRKEIFSFAIPSEHLDLLYQIGEEYGMNLSQIGREATLMWLASHNMIPPTDVPRHLLPKLNLNLSTSLPLSTGVAASTIQQDYELANLSNSNDNDE